MNLDEDSIKRVESILKEWTQGDCVLGGEFFFHRFLPQNPVTEASVDNADGDFELVATEEEGLAVLTQTCDIVRELKNQPYLELCPLVKVSEDQVAQVSKGLRPRYAFIPGVADQCLVADLSRVMTVEKPVASSWERVQGCFTAKEQATFAQDIARKRQRFAFPDDFTIFAGRFLSHLRKKHEKKSDAGKVLRNLREIRVQATPSWDAEEVELFFLFIRLEETELPEIMFATQVEAWLKKLPVGGRYKAEGSVFELEDLTAADYVTSQRLDLDYLSSHGKALP